MNKKTLLALTFAAGVLILFSLLRSTSVTPSPSPSPAKTTIPPQSRESIDILNQGRADSEFNKALQSFSLRYPWYNKIPPKNDDFFIVFDASKKTFFVELFPKNSSSQSLEEQTTSLKSEVLKKLKEIGVDINQYSFDWTISPK